MSFVPTSAGQNEQAPISKDLHLVEMIHKVNNLVEKHCQRFLQQRYGLTVPQYQFLLVVATAEFPTLGLLAEHLNCSRGNLTGVADRLERDGYLLRRRSAEDRRVIEVQLTDKGRMIMGIKDELDIFLADLVKKWAPEEKSAVLAGLSTMLIGIQEAS